MYFSLQFKISDKDFFNKDLWFSRFECHYRNIKVCFLFLTSESFHAIVNPRIEPIIKDNIGVIKKGKGKEGKRYCAATPAALYLCKVMKFLRPLKISHFFPWVELSEIDLSHDNKIIFTFKEEVLEIAFDEAQSFIQPILSFLYQLFENNSNMPFKVEFGNLQIDVSQDQKQNYCMIGYLYLSFCKSLNVQPNDSLLNNLIFLQSCPLISIDFLQLKVDQKSFKPLLLSLKYICNIKYLLIPGTEVEKIFNFLQPIIINNSSNLTDLLIDGSTSFDSFGEFCHAVCTSSVRSLAFRRVNFPTTLLVNLFEKLPSSNLKKIKFYYCQLDQSVITYMHSNFKYFTKLAVIALNNCDLFKDHSVLEMLFQFLMQSKISKIELVGDHIDVGDVFQIIDEINQSIPLYKINLSKNDCVNFTGQYKMPITLNKLILSRVQWTTKSLMLLLTEQKFANLISIDLSYLQGNISDLHSKFKPLVQSTNTFREIKWNLNLISDKFFIFLEKFTELRSLSLNECYYEPGKLPEIANSMVFYIQTSKLKELSFRGSSQTAHTEIINELFAVIRGHQTLETIDISNNAIGDNGLKNFVSTIGSNNNIISRVAFDGSNANDPDLYIHLLQKLSKMSKIKYIVKPRVDIERLSKMHGSSIWKKLDEAWNNLSKEITNHNMMFHSPNDLTSKQYASWDININLNADPQTSYNSNNYSSSNDNIFSLNNDGGISSSGGIISSNTNFNSIGNVHRGNYFSSINRNNFVGITSNGRRNSVNDYNRVAKVNNSGNVININNDIKSSDDWAILRERFSLAKITGITKLSSVNNNSQNNLIVLEGD